MLQAKLADSNAEQDRLMKIIADLEVKGGGSKRGLYPEKLCIHFNWTDTYLR